MRKAGYYWIQWIHKVWSEKITPQIIELNRGPLYEIALLEYYGDSDRPQWSICGYDGPVGKEGVSFVVIAGPTEPPTTRHTPRFVHGNCGTEMVHDGEDWKCPKCELGKEKK